MVIQRHKHPVTKRKVSQPVVEPAEQIKRTRNRPFRTPYGREGQSVTTYRNVKEFYIKDQKGNQVEIDPFDIPSLILALLETDRKSKVHH